MKSLLNQQVTVYRQSQEGICRSYWENAHLQVARKLVTDDMGRYIQQDFLLILPPEADVRPGDRVVAGCAPQIQAWAQLGSDALQVQRVELCYLDGKAHHVEAM